MRVETTTEFRRKVARQIKYISFDKPNATKNFKNIIFSEIKKLKEMPYKNKQSKFFDDENIRELIIKGYSIIYIVEKEDKKIVVFGFHKWEEDVRY
ncbi:type II toxin-antitoxin system RelE/ParE family toxin [Epilithonimonas sp. UC225_85]|uniref:type II toxin-antitoxin system RelE/ParE family toxin n=1 Tax=Epilithonimonas sp. UC225_85 TaxID=3350167 RepID=UPI0036D26881